MLKYFRKNGKENLNSHIQLFKDNKLQKHKSHSQRKKCEKHGLLLISIKPVCSPLNQYFPRCFWGKKKKVLKCWHFHDFPNMLCSCDLFVFSSFRTANKFQNIVFLWWTAGDSHSWTQAVPVQETSVVIFPWHCPSLLLAAADPTQQEAGSASTECCSQLKNTGLGFLRWAGSNRNEGEVSQGDFPAEKKASPGEGKNEQHQNFTILATCV